MHAQSVVVQHPCPICGKATAIALIEPHPTHPERELHTYRCLDCGPVKTTSVRPHSGRLTRAAQLPILETAESQLAQPLLDCADGFTLRQ
jgi:predicted RNA-binding Zn-ribbon protein involved in translation (DUF1610 family)